MPGRGPPSATCSTAPSRRGASWAVSGSTLWPSSAPTSHGLARLGLALEGAMVDALPGGRRARYQVLRVAVPLLPSAWARRHDANFVVRLKRGT